MSEICKMEIPKLYIPLTEIAYHSNVQLFMKREDLVHPEISGNKYWKLFYNINLYIKKNKENPLVVTFGGAFSNHIAAVSAVGRKFNIPTLGIIRGEELKNQWKDNPTLCYAAENGMQFHFVSREEYRDKEALTFFFENKFPNAIVIPEGGSNENAVEGIKMMLNNETKEFDYLCIAVGTGGSVAGISEFCEDYQKVLGFKVVKDDSLDVKISTLTSKQNFNLIQADYGGYGKFSDELIGFVNSFKNQFHIPLEPIYTGKMMKRVFEMVDEGFFPKGSKILCFHTGGLQGIAGANNLLKKQKRNLIL